MAIGHCLFTILKAEIMNKHWMLKIFQTVTFFIMMP